MHITLDIHAEERTENDKWKDWIVAILRSSRTLLRPQPGSLLET